MKTASELGLQPKTYEALIAVRDKLADGRFRHLTEEELDELRKDRAFEGVFNMTIDLKNNYKCGTVGCIGGWMSMELGEKRNVDVLMAEDAPKSEWHYDPRMQAKFEEFYTGESNPLYPLFFPYGMDDWDELTPADAAKAIDEFLETGDAEMAWASAVYGDGGSVI